MTDFSAIPKVELHLHIEGAAPPDLVRALAAEQGLDLSPILDDAGGYRWADFTEFLACYDAVAAMFTTPEAWLRLTEGVLANSAAHGVIYTEIFISSSHLGNDPGAWAEHLAVLEQGAAAAEAAHGIVTRFIPLCVRNFGPEMALEAARLATVDHPRIVGFGMAGDERVYAPADFAPAFAIAREAGLGLTAHAGEHAGPESVRAALDDLGLSRIDHGVRAAEDPALVARLAGEGTHLTVCPGSNIALGVYPDWAAHPVAALRDAGVSVSVNTDDPPHFHTNMTREFTELSAAHGWSAETCRAIGRDALAAAFCDDTTKARLAPLLT